MRGAYNDEMARCHADRANDEGGLAAPAVDVHDSGDGGYEHDDAYNAGCEKGDGIAGKTKFTENDGCIVKHCVDTGPPARCQSRKPL